MIQRLFIALLIFIISSGVSFAAKKKGIEKVKSKYTFTQTVDRLEDQIKRSKLNIFQVIDHRENALNAGFRLNPTTLFIVGNPEAGTPLMKCEQSFALDLPQKILVYEDDEGVVWVAYNNQNFLKKRHRMKKCELNLERVQTTLENLVRETALRID